MLWLTLPSADSRLRELELRCSGTETRMLNARVSEEKTETGHKEERGETIRFKIFPGSSSIS